jgi:hypothetical protein
VENLRAARRRLAVLGLGLTLLGPTTWPASAQAAEALGAAGAGLSLVPPVDTVVLELRGRVAARNLGDCACFDMAMLAALPQVSFSTRTPWFAGARRFTGPLLRDVLAAAGASGARLRLRALNDYRVDLPWDDAERHGPILARLLDGVPMAVRDKGPLFLIYPFDDRPDLRSAVYYNRSAWQLRAIEVE